MQSRIKLLKYFLNKVGMFSGSLLDVGSGSNFVRGVFPFLDVFSVDFREGSDYRGSIEDFASTNMRLFDFVWCSHVLEHALNVNMFLHSLYKCVTTEGHVGILVPPRKDFLVGGHVSLFTPASLCYNIVMSAQDLSKAVVVTYGYNIGVLWKYSPVELPALRRDAGDLETLSALFPIPVFQNIDGVTGWSRIRSENFEE